MFKSKTFCLVMTLIDAALCALNLHSFIQSGSIFSLMLAGLMGWLGWGQLNRYLEARKNV